MSDETPRELTEQEIDDLLRMRASVWRREAIDVRGLTGVVVTLDTLQSLCHMARRGARELEKRRSRRPLAVEALEDIVSSNGPCELDVVPGRCTAHHQRVPCMYATAKDVLTRLDEESAW